MAHYASGTRIRPGNGDNNQPVQRPVPEPHRAICRPILFVSATLVRLCSSRILSYQRRFFERHKDELFPGPSRLT